MDNLIAKASTTIGAPRYEVWDALVTPATIKKYMFGSDVSSDFEAGSPITFKGEWQGRAYEDKGVVKRVEPQRLLQYTHYSPLSGLPDTEENYHTVTIELADAGDKTRVILTQDKNRDEQERDHSQQNWSNMLAALKDLLERS